MPHDIAASKQIRSLFLSKVKFAFRFLVALVLVAACCSSVWATAQDFNKIEDAIKASEKKLNRIQDRPASPKDYQAWSTEINLVLRNLDDAAARIGSLKNTASLSGNDANRIAGYEKKLAESLQRTLKRKYDADEAEINRIGKMVKIAASSFPKEFGGASYLANIKSLDDSISEFKRLSIAEYLALKDLNLLPKTMKIEPLIDNFSQVNTTLGELQAKLLNALMNKLDEKYKEFSQKLSNKPVDLAKGPVLLPMAEEAYGIITNLMAHAFIARDKKLDLFWTVLKKQSPPDYVTGVPLKMRRLILNYTRQINVSVGSVNWRQYWKERVAKLRTESDHISQEWIKFKKEVDSYLGQLSGDSIAAAEKKKACVRMQGLIKTASKYHGRGQKINEELQNLKTWADLLILYVKFKYLYPQILGALDAIMVCDKQRLELEKDKLDLNDILPKGSPNGENSKTPAPSEALRRFDEAAGDITALLIAHDCHAELQMTQ